ncbi:MAG: DUF1289 domain-containing protein [Alphaproteobacteria bacterium]
MPIYNKPMPSANPPLAKTSLPDPLPSPCVGVCKMDDERRYCNGCLRSIPEIKIWSTASEQQKHHILQALKIRRRERGIVSAASLKPRRRQNPKANP